MSCSSVVKHQRTAFSSRSAGRRAGQRLAHCKASASAQAIGKDSHLQLATAKIPSQVSVEAFKEGMYQWAASMTASGKNQPFSLPLQCDRTKGGFDIAFLRVIEQNVIRQARISCTIEDIDNDSIFFARLYAVEPFPDGRVPPGDDTAKLKALLAALTDVPNIMNTMQQAIRAVCSASVKRE